MATADQKLIADLESEVAESADRFSDQQQTSGVRPPPVIEVSQTETESTPFGGVFGEVSAEPAGDSPDCPECPSGACSSPETVTGAINGVPATLVVCTDGSGWSPIA